jgi:hypothetical protein
MVSFCVLVLPIVWWLSTTDLRSALLSGSGLSFLGATLKCIVRRDLYAVSFTGQTFTSIANIFVLIIPGVVSAVWFPKVKLFTNQ